MPEDLGTWPPEQATVLLEVLQQAGLSPNAKRTRDGIVVTVPDDESAEAHRQLVTHMDRIARAAARPAPPRRRGGRGSRREHPAHGHQGEPPLASERLQRLGRPLGILLIGLLVAAIVPPLRFPVIVLTVAGMVYMVGKQPPHQDGPG